MDFSHLCFLRRRGNSALQIVRRCKRTWKQARRALVRTSKRNQRHANQLRRPAPSFHPGQRVWLSAKDLPLRVESRKLAPRYVGPFKVVRRINPVCYLQLPRSLKITPPSMCPYYALYSLPLWPPPLKHPRPPRVFWGLPPPPPPPPPISPTFPGGFFPSGCAPGSEPSSTFCQQCAGSGSGVEDGSKCSASSVEKYYGYAGAFR